MITFLLILDLIMKRSVERHNSRGLIKEVGQRNFPRSVNCFVFLFLHCRNAGHYGPSEESL
jgi:hypothetical protein